MRRLITSSNKRHKWNRVIVIHTIQGLSKEHLYSTWVKNNNNALWKAAVRYYGSWGKAVSAAGINYDSVRRAGPSGAPPNKGKGGICQKPGCTRLHHAKGLCKKCYTIKMRQEKLKIRVINASGKTVDRR